MNQLTNNRLLIIAKVRILIANDTVGEFTQPRTACRADHLLAGHVTLVPIRIASHRVGNDIANF